MLYYSRKYYWKNPSNREKKTNFSTNYYTNVEYTERIIANKMQINDVNKFEWNNFILFFLSYMLIWAPVGISCRFIICVWRIHLRAENGIYVIENIVEHWLFWLVVLFSHDGWRTWFSLIFEFQRNALNTHTHTQTAIMPPEYVFCIQNITLNGFCFAHFFVHFLWFLCVYVSLRFFQDIQQWIIEITKKFYAHTKKS